MFRSIATIIVILIFTSYALRSSYGAMLMYWWFSLFRPQDFMYWDISSIRIPLIAAIIFFVPAFLRLTFPHLRNFIATLIILWFGWAIVADIVAGCNNKDGNLNLAYVAVFFLTMAMTEPLISTRRKILGFVFIASLSICILTGKSGLYALVTGANLYGINIGSGSFTGTNAAAMGTVQALFMVIFMLVLFKGKFSSELIPEKLNSRFFRRCLVFFLLIVLVGSIYFVIGTQSRGSAIAMIVGLFIWLLLQPRKLLTLSLTAIVAAVTLTFVPLPDGYSDRLSSSFAGSEEMDNSAASRPHFWRLAAKMAADNPTGIGVGCYSYYYNAYDDTAGKYGSWRSVHSSHFAVLSDLGYVGVLLWVLLLLGSYAKLGSIRSQTKKHYKQCPRASFFYHLSNALIASQTAFIVGGSFYEMLYNYYTWMIFCVVIASTEILKSRPIDPKNNSVETNPASGSVLSNSGFKDLKSASVPTNHHRNEP